MAVYSSPSIPLDGLVFSIDAGNAKSYSGSGTNVLDPINNIQHNSKGQPLLLCYININATMCI